MKADFSELMVNSEELLEKAKSKLYEKLNLDPNNVNLLWHYAEILRQRGELVEAIDCYGNILSIQPEHISSRYIFNVLSGVPISSAPEGTNPAPFIRIKDYFDVIEQEKIWSTVKNNKEYFSNSLVENDLENKSYRRSNVIHKNKLTEITPFFFKKLANTLSTVWPYLPIIPFHPTTKEIQLTMHHNGEFFKIHKDTLSAGFGINRKITFVYYFHSVPKKYSGGELLLYDTNTSNDTFTCKYTRLSPLNNSIVIFLSSFYHQVTPLISEGESIEDGRLTLNGWIHDR